MVTVKKAWFRVISNGYNNALVNTGISSKVGTNGSTTNSVYNYTPAATTIQPAFYIFHVIPSVDYAELQIANATSSKKVYIDTINSSANQGGLSAELMITYTYTSETTGYLTSHELFAGQQDYTNSGTWSTTTATANMVAPETIGKTIRAGALRPFYLISNSTGAMTNTNITMDANLSTGAPACTNAYIVRPNGVNGATEFYRDVTSALSATDSQTYSACYSHNGSAVATVGAKMNGTLTYTYSWDDTAPTSTFASAQERADGTGLVDIAINVNDIDGDDLRVRLEYEAGTSCSFASSLRPVLATTSISVNYGTPAIDTEHDYQIGTTSFMIPTNSGQNTVSFSWISTSSLDNLEGVYCLRSTANDLGYSQIMPATTTLIIDNKAPSVPGPLSFISRANDSITMNLGATSVESYFKEYKIFYKVYDGLEVTEDDTPWASSSDEKLGNQLFMGGSTTTIADLIASTTYSLAIWAYDLYGHKASSSRIEMTTNGTPTSTLIYAEQKDDGSGTVDMTILAADSNEDNLRVKISYVNDENCNFDTPLPATLDSDSATIVVAHGATPVVNNIFPYQLGTTTGWIETSYGVNTVSFDWLALNNLGYDVDDTYCLRIIANDQIADQNGSSTMTVAIDTKAPTAPGSLSENYRGNNYIIVNFGATTTENHFKEYKIFYKIFDGSEVTEGDFVHSSSTDENLGLKEFGGFSTTTVSDLLGATTYSFSIWTYDFYGNIASSSKVEISTRTNNRASSTFNSAVFRLDGSGIIDISMKVFDADADDIRVKAEYASDCSFAPSLDPYLDPLGITASDGTPAIDNDFEYQIGTTSAMIPTINGENTVSFDWLTKENFSSDGANYCIRITANDLQADQLLPATTTVYLDNQPPSAPGPLSFSSRTNAAISMDLGATSTETHFTEYKIFYKIYDGFPVTEADSAWSSSSDEKLGNQLFMGGSTTTISGLIASTTYSLAIWAFDTYGNKASSSKIEMTTNGAPFGTIDYAGQKDDGSGAAEITIMADDPNDDIEVRAKIQYVLGAACDFTFSDQASLNSAAGAATSSYGDHPGRGQCLSLPARHDHRLDRG